MPLKYNLFKFDGLKKLIIFKICFEMLKVLLTAYKHFFYNIFKLLTITTVWDIRLKEVLVLV